MATSRTFNAMLNEYLPNKLLKEEIIKRDYILNKVQKDDSWKGGKLIVPFKAAGASSLSFGALTAANDIAESNFVRGSIDDYVELWGSMIFNQRDLMEHDGKIPETTFIKALTDTTEDFMTYMKEMTSIAFTNGAKLATVTAEASAASGIFTVDYVDRFCLGQKVSIDDSNSSAMDVYVIAINLNTNEVQFSDSRGGAGYNLAAYTIAQGAAFYYVGGWSGTASTTFVSMKDALLSAANGGSSTIHGKSKVAYPYLQAINVNGATITESNLLDKLFDAYTEIRRKARGNANTILMSYKHLGTAMKSIELNKGAYKTSVNTTKASLYGWTEITITSVKGELTLVGIQEMSDSEIYYIDWSSITFRSNGFFQKRTSPEGKQYFEVRNTTGYQYIVDISLFGEMEYTRPGCNGAIYGISY